jgi:A/G-specific adenine glycosylase
MAIRNPQSAIRNPQSSRLVPALLRWFSANARDLPWRRTRDPYAIWVSEIMLQQTQVKTVMPYWERWMRELPTIKAAASASPAKIHKFWEGLGYYTRVRNLQKAARQIVEKHNGKFPNNFDDVLALPGIGRYTAGAICSIAFNQPTPILDGNVIRVLTRVFGIGKNPREKKTNARLWQLAEELVGRAVPCPPRRGRDTAPSHSSLNQSLMELGALVCTPRQPQCPVCPVKKLCVAFCEGRVTELPSLGKRATATARRFIAFVVERNGNILVRQRPAGVVNAQLWEFPNAESIDTKPDVKEIFKSIFGIEPPEVQPFCTVKHSITRYRITLEAFHVHLGGTSYTSPLPKSAKSGTHKTRPAVTGIWKTPAQMQSLAFTSAHRKVLGTLKTRAGR